jgi:hypothetical protein
VEFDSAFQVYAGVMSVIVPDGEINVAAPGTASCATTLFKQKNTRPIIVSIHKQSLAHLKYKRFIALILLPPQPEQLELLAVSDDGRFYEVERSIS